MNNNHQIDSATIDSNKIEEVLATLRPMLHQHGGDVEFVKLEGTTVYVRLIGACVGCPISSYTVTYGIQETLQQQFPSITKVTTVE
jgi:Fe-S cluster biogenesis protein NfuA